MTMIEAIILGIVQGLTEFLPISSSGHLTLVQAFFQMKNIDQLLPFDIVCHLGTLAVILWSFRDTLLKLNWATCWKIILGTAPLVPLVLLLKPIKGLFNSPEYLGYFFIWTAFLLIFAHRVSKKATALPLEKRTDRDVGLIGVFQATAILPGVSRSGSTIAAAKLLGWDNESAYTFSFLLAIPAILGATILEFTPLLLGSSKHTIPIALEAYLAGFLTSFVMGYFALAFLKKVLQKNHLIYFAVYCLIIGVASLIYFHDKA